MITFLLRSTQTTNNQSNLVNGGTDFRVWPEKRFYEGKIFQVHLKLKI